MREQRKGRIDKIVLDCKHCPFFGRVTKESCAMTEDNVLSIPETCPLSKTMSVEGRIIVTKEEINDSLS